MYLPMSVCSVHAQDQQRKQQYFLMLLEKENAVISDNWVFKFKLDYSEMSGRPNNMIHNVLVSLGPEIKPAFYSPGHKATISDKLFQLQCHSIPIVKRSKQHIT